jgi:hypothetical protein
MQNKKTKAPLVSFLNLKAKIIKLEKKVKEQEKRLKVLENFIIRVSK